MNILSTVSIIGNIYCSDSNNVCDEYNDDGDEMLIIIVIFSPMLYGLSI